VIQNSEIKPLGDTKTYKINLRIISASNKDLIQAIAEKEFREDLFYRLNVLPIHLPPLRERKIDIPLLLNYFLKREALRLGVSQKRISKKALQYLEDYQWEGNIRELENFVKYILSTVDNDIVGVNELPDHFKKEIYQKKSDNPFSFPEDSMVSGNNLSRASFEAAESPFAGYCWEDLEKDYVFYLLNKNRWNITRAARDAKINRSTFDSRMKRLGIHKG